MPINGTGHPASLSADKARTYFLYLALFINGAIILVIEIAGARLLVPFFGSTIFVWSSLIAVTLGFLAVGYFIGGLIADRRPSGALFYLFIFLGGAASLLLSKFTQPVLVFSDAFGFRVGPLVAALILFALPIVLLGIPGPFLVRLRARMPEQTGRTSGAVFAISTLGSLAGALLTGFYLIPNFFLSSILTASALLAMGTAFIGLLLEKAAPRLPLVSLVLLLLIFVLPVIRLPEDPTFSIIHHEPSFYADLKVGDLDLGPTEGAYRCLFMDGAPQTCMMVKDGSFPWPYVEELARLSRGWPGDAQILLLGLGGGALAKLIGPRFAVDIVEIDPKIAELAKRYFGFRLDPNDRLILDDARSFLRRTDRQYDVIITDLVFGNGLPIHLYTKETSELLRRRLTKRGVVLANIVAYLEGERNLALSLIRTHASVFPHIIVTSYSLGPDNNALVHAFSDDRYAPSFVGKYGRRAVHYERGAVITDARNPLDFMVIEGLGRYLDYTKALFGYAPRFSIP